MKRLRVAFNNEQELIDITTEFKKLLRSCCRCALIEADFDENSEISVSFVDNSRIQEINSEFRNIDSPTDVLSFPMADNCEFDLNPDSECYTLGDIIISTERASQQAEEIGHTVQREIAFLVVHSMLHLLGYDHHEEDGEDTLEMRRMERLILSKMGLLNDSAANKMN